ncbi:N-acylglucosamine 2-epimerase-like [Plakobranchus ocellatus]|uniref:N-acylglucosamine 2-epimerase n=1 Tax=Plakobranchus ocellatus TaxID=259542 RepID=A0AAV3Z8G0_9GAST|nr:N-acylglucosamine 2-epimerase-like [Plakobranchus ocellatus]
MSDNLRQRLPEFYKQVSDNLDSTIQFWLQHSIDKKEGGFFTCLEADGTVYDTTKYSWPICRQVWTLARLYKEVQRFHVPHILEAITKGAEFIMKHVKNQSTGRCYLSLTREGKPLKLQRTIFSEAFYVMAMSEMYRVTSEDQYKKEAMSTMKNIIHWVRVDNTEIGLSVTPPSRTSSLAVPMILLMLIGQLEIMEPAHEASFSDLAQWCIDEVLKHAIKRDGVFAVLESVGEDGQELSGCSGRLMNPGHAIEAGWFLLERAIKHGRKDLQTLALEAFISSSFQRGWDAEFGGLYSFLDVEGRPPMQLEWDMKMWWPHNEAMIAFLMAYKHTGDEEYLKKFAQVFDYSFQHFVDVHHGEWFGYLSREGKVKINAKGGQWKGCFHIPRALMMCEKILHEVLQSS